MEKMQKQLKLLSYTRTNTISLTCIYFLLCPCLLFPHFNTQKRSSLSLINPTNQGQMPSFLKRKNLTRAQQHSRDNLAIMFDLTYNRSMRIEGASFLRQNHRQRWIRGGEEEYLSTHSPIQAGISIPPVGESGRKKPPFPGTIFF